MILGIRVKDSESGRVANSVTIMISRYAAVTRDMPTGDVSIDLTQQEFDNLANRFLDWRVHDEKLPAVFEKTPGTVEQFRSWVERLKEIAQPKVNYDPDVDMMKTEVINKSRSLASQVFMEIEDFLAIPRKVQD